MIDWVQQYTGSLKVCFWCAAHDARVHVAVVDRRQWSECGDTADAHLVTISHNTFLRSHEHKRPAQEQLDSIFRCLEADVRR